LSFKLSTSIVAAQLCDVQSIHPFSQTPINPVRSESRRFPAGAKPARPIGRSAGSNQVGPNEKAIGLGGDSPMLTANCRPDRREDPRSARHPFVQWRAASSHRD
jgi:hypothetical protein